MYANKRRFEILIAEDNSADVGLVREALREHELDCVLHVVTDGASAIAFINGLDSDPESPELDCVLVDMHLPKRSGEDFLHSLRCTERNAQVPVIVMTGAHSTSIEEKAMKHAALSYFRKPSTLDGFLELGAIVRDILMKDRREAPVKTDSAKDGR